VPRWLTATAGADPAPHDRSRRPRPLDEAGRHQLKRARGDDDKFFAEFYKALRQLDYLVCRVLIDSAKRNGSALFAPNSPEISPDGDQISG
jgi:hypothetical protein